MENRSRRGWWILIGIVVIVAAVAAFLYFTRGAGVPTVPSGQLYYYRNPDYIAPSLGVTTDFQLYDPENEAHVTAVAERYTEVYIQGQPFVEAANLPILKEGYAIVAANQLGTIGNFILPPGNYYRLAASDVTIVDAVIVQEPNYGIMRTANGDSFELLPPGVHRALAQQVRFFPSGPQRYRLISEDLLTRTTAGEINACQSLLCETTMNGVLTSDSAVRVSVDLEVNFELQFDDSTDLARLYELRDVNSIITTYLSSPIRSQGRALWGDISPAEMQTRAGWQKMADALQTMLEEQVAGQPITIISVGIRGVELPPDYLSSQTEGAAEEQALQADLRIAEVSQSATATASAFEREQQQLETAQLAADMSALRDALGSDDPVVVCGILNFYRPGSCSFPMPVSVNVDQNGQ